MRARMTAALLIACCVAPGAAQHTGKPAVHTVTIDATSFSPAALTLRPGDTVEWVNKDVIPHTATASQKGGFDSGEIAAGSSWRHTFETKGVVPYVCTFHPTMKGGLRVLPERKNDRPSAVDERPRDGEGGTATRHRGGTRISGNETDFTDREG